MNLALHVHTADILGDLSKRQSMSTFGLQTGWLTSAIANTLSTAPTSLSCETVFGTESLTALNTNDDMRDNKK